MQEISHLQRSEIHLWFADLKSLDRSAMRNEVAHWLHGEEKNRYNRYQSQSQREHFLFGRVLLKTILSKYIGCTPVDLKFDIDTRGKPFLSSNNTLSVTFNLSHSDNRLVFAVSKSQDLGVDLEIIKKERAILKIAERYFSPAETRELRNLPKASQVKRFYELWTLKESVLKACGSGLSRGLSKIEFSFPTSDKLIMHSAPGNGNLTNWQSWQIEEYKNYMLAVSVKSLDIKIDNIKSFDFISFDETGVKETSIVRSS